MTTTHETRPAGEVDARQLDGTQSGNEAVRVWARQYVGEENVVVPNMMSWSSVSISTPQGTVIAAGNQYLYWDGEQIRAADKQTFELVYRPIS